MSGRQVSTTTDLCLYFIAVFVSPIPVFLKTGCGADLIINIALFILGWIPGVIHAWWIIGKYSSTKIQGGRHHVQPGAYSAGPVYQPPQPTVASGYDYTQPAQQRVGKF